MPVLASAAPSFSLPRRPSSPLYKPVSSSLHLLQWTQAGPVSLHWDLNACHRLGTCTHPATVLAVQLWMNDWMNECHFLLAGPSALLLLLLLQLSFPDTTSQLLQACNTDGRLAALNASARPPRGLQPHGLRSDQASSMWNQCRRFLRVLFRYT